jgi:hypothetical protein
LPAYRAGDLELMNIVFVGEVHRTQIEFIQYRSLRCRMLCTPSSRMLPSRHWWGSIGLLTRIPPLLF